MTKIVARAIMGAIVTLAPSWAQPTASPAERFEELVRAEMKDERMGMAVAVTSQGRVVYAKAFGPANLETNQPVSLDSVWTPTALSEIYSAVVVVTLAREGVLALDVPIAKYWGELHPLVGRITIRQLFQFRGGIKDDHIDFPLLDAGSLKRYALSCAANCIIAEPGEVESFSSRSGNLAAAVAEQASGKNFGDLLDARVFKPMEFKRTSLSILQVATQPIVQGHREGASGWEIVRPLALNWVGWPTTSVFTSVAEGISFIGALVNEGEWNGRQVFSKPLVSEILSLLARRSGAFTATTHWAGIAGHHFFLPEKNFGLLIFTNGPSKSTLLRSISYGARAIWLGEAAPASPAPAVQAAPLSEIQAAELTGVYRNEYVIRLEWREGSLRFFDEGTSYRKPTEWIAVNRVSDTRFVLAKPHVPYGSDLSLVLSTKGVVTHIMFGGRAFRKDP
jgi:CubicO group peptidase (beta-lactamase class C family)